MIAERLNGIGEYYFSAKMREIAAIEQAGRPVINLGIGSPDLPPHPEVIRALQNEAAKADAHAYQGYKGIPGLRNAYADWYLRSYNVSLDPGTEVLPLIGSKEGIMHICMTYLNPGDIALIPDPGYPTYSSAVRLAGGMPHYYGLCPEEQGGLDWAALEAMDLSRVKLMFINYPHMPTGQTASPLLLRRLVDFARKHKILLLHDNPYSFILNDTPLSIFQVEGARAVAMELNSLSKSHNMAGWRLGFLAGAQSRIDEVLRFKSNMDSGMFRPLQVAAIKALELGQDWYAGVNAVYALRCEKARSLMALLHCSVQPGQAGMFLWGQVPPGIADGFGLSDMVLEQCNVFITPGGIFGTNGLKHIRISLCKDIDELDAAITNVRQAISQGRLLPLATGISL